MSKRVINEQIRDAILGFLHDRASDHAHAALTSAFTNWSHELDSVGPLTYTTRCLGVRSGAYLFRVIESTVPEDAPLPWLALMADRWRAQAASAPTDLGPEAIAIAERLIIQFRPRSERLLVSVKTGEVFDATGQGLILLAKDVPTFFLDEVARLRAIAPRRLVLDQPSTDDVQRLARAWPAAEQLEVRSEKPASAKLVSAIGASFEALRDVRVVDANAELWSCLGPRVNVTHVREQ